jgi:hypothetical protein
MLAGGGPAPARVLGRRSAPGSRYRPAMRRTRAAASARGIPAAVTNSGRPEDPRTTAPRGSRCGTWAWPPRSPGCRTRRAHGRPGRAGRRGPGRRSRRPPAGPARADRAGPRPMRRAGQGHACAAGRPPRILPSAEARARRATHLPAAGSEAGGAAREASAASRTPGTSRVPARIAAVSTSRWISRGCEAFNGSSSRAAPEQQPGLAALPGPSLAVYCVRDAPRSASRFLSQIMMVWPPK